MKNSSTFTLLHSSSSPSKGQKPLQVRGKCDFVIKEFQYQEGKLERSAGWRREEWEGRTVGGGGGGSVPGSDHSRVAF